MCGWGGGSCQSDPRDGSLHASGKLADEGVTDARSLNQPLRGRSSPPGISNLSNCASAREPQSDDRSGVMKNPLSKAPPSFRTLGRVGSAADPPPKHRGDGK